MRHIIQILGVAGCALAAFLRCDGISQAAEDSPGADIFQRRCAACHDAPTGRIPSHEQLGRLSPAQVLQALRAGVMREQAKGLSVYQMQLVAAFLTGREPAEPQPAGPEANPCARLPPPLRPTNGDWNGWSPGAGNARYQSTPGISLAQVPRLRLLWAYGYRGSYAYGPPTVVGGRLFTGSSTGRVYAIDARSGCTIFTFDADTGVRTAPVVATLPAHGAARQAVIFGDDAGNVYAIDAANGKLLWRVKADLHAAARITAAPAVAGNRVYIGVSSLEEVAAADPRYACCTFGGKVVALDVATGRRRWTAHMTAPVGPLPPTAEGSGGRPADPAGVPLRFGPAGASIWNSPTIDAPHDRLFVGTGNSYTSLNVTTSDAVVALRLSTGALLWSAQLNPGDNFTVGCPTVNCPVNPGPDVDFGASVILHRASNGRITLLASQKSGWVYALDPQDGAVRWRVQLSPGSPLGGVEWGAAADERAIYVPISDALLPPDAGKPGLTALSIRTGEVLWHVEAPLGECAWHERSNCLHAFQQAASAIPGAVFAGSLDGHLRAYAARDGRLLWDYDTAHAYQSVNGIATEGGSLDIGGAVIADGRLYVNSGYGRLIGQPGNALLAFVADPP